jgi:methionyl-tRNA formyltransferase
MKIVFFGTPDFAAKILNTLLEQQFTVSAVVTKPDRPKGRSGSPVPGPVKLLAQANHIPLYQPEIVSAPEFAPTLEAYKADLFVVVAFGEIIKQHLLDMPKLGCINIHASLLPKYRGAAPIQRSIIEGETETGITIMHMVKKMDAGDMIEMASIPIGPNMTFGELEKELCDKGADLLTKVLKDFQQGIIKRTPQDHTKATLAPKIELEDCQIQWNKSAQTIHNLVRGVNPHPIAWCLVDVRGQTKRLKVLKTEVIESQSDQEKPGSIVNSSPKELIIACGQNFLKLHEVQLEGKKQMTVEEFLRGFSKESMRF